MERNEIGTQVMWQRGGVGVRLGDLQRCFLSKWVAAFDSEMLISRKRLFSCYEYSSGQNAALQSL
jgi:hypothetical protein